MKRLLSVFPLVAVTAVLAGCGAGSSESTNASATVSDGEAMEAEKMEAAKMTAEKAEAAKMEAKEASGATAAAKPRRRGTKLRIVDSQFGRVIADGKGEALYIFDREQRGRSECYGACAKAWPPVLTKGQPRAGAGAKAGLLGTTRRANGKLQVTYAGQPLYYYVHDEPGLILCHDVDEFGGLWLVVHGNGKAAA